LFLHIDQKLRGESHRVSGCRHSRRQKGDEIGARLGRELDDNFHGRLLPPASIPDRRGSRIGSICAPTYAARLACGDGSVASARRLPDVRDEQEQQRQDGDEHGERDVIRARREDG
jgi:hypothetical protein